MTKIKLEIPQELLDTIDEEYEKRGYTSRSEAIRDALRAWVDPPIRLSEDILEDLEVSGEQRERGETLTLREIREQFGLDYPE